MPGGERFMFTSRPAPVCYSRAFLAAQQAAVGPGRPGGALRGRAEPGARAGGELGVLLDHLPLLAQVPRQRDACTSHGKGASLESG